VPGVLLAWGLPTRWRGLEFSGGVALHGEGGGGRDRGATATQEETGATPLALARRGPAAHCLDGAAAAEENTLAPPVERLGVMPPPTTAHRLGEAGAAEGGGRPGPSRWHDMAGDCSRTIRGDAAWGYRPPGTSWPRRHGSGGAAGGRAPQRGGAVHRMDGTQGWRREPLPCP
jgi:hypothetical protein